MPLSEDKHSLVSDGSEVGKEGSSAASVADSTDSGTVGSSNGSSGLSPHYDANQDVILRLEFLRTAEIKVWGVSRAGGVAPFCCRRGAPSLLGCHWGRHPASVLRRLALSLFTQAQQTAHASPLPAPLPPHLRAGHHPYRTRRGGGGLGHAHHHARVQDRKGAERLAAEPPCSPILPGSRAPMHAHAAGRWYPCPSPAELLPPACEEWRGAGPSKASPGAQACTSSAGPRSPFLAIRFPMACACVPQPPPPPPPAHPPLDLQSDQHYLRTNTVPIVNLAFGCPLLAAQLTCFLMFFYRVYRWVEGGRASFARLLHVLRPRLRSSRLLCPFENYL